MNELLEQRKLEQLDQLIGNTPMVEIRYVYKGRESRVFAKVESFNLTGSVKDRVALYILKDGVRTGKLKPGDIIVEATSGNTGIAFAAIGAYLGHPVEIYMPDWMSEERKKMIRSFGAKIVPVSREEGGFIGSIDMTKKAAEENDNIFLPSQFENELNVDAQYNSLGLEILRQLKDLGLTPDGFVGGVGTGGTVMGVAKAFREVNPDAKISPLEPLESPVLTKKEKVGNHRIAGISDEFVPPICDLDYLDDIISISDGDAILAAQALAENGLPVGISSGSNFLGAVTLKEKLGDDAVVCTVLPDDNKKYLSTALMEEEPMKDTYIMKDLELGYFKSYR